MKLRFGEVGVTENAAKWRTYFGTWIKDYHLQLTELQYNVQIILGATQLHERQSRI